MKYSRPLYSIDNLIFDSNTKSYNYISQRERLYMEVLVASGTFTQANARLSLVDGTAFFDCGADLSAYAGLDSGSHEHLIKVYDDNGNSIQGYVGAVGGGETLGADALGGIGAFTDDTGWGLGINWAMNGTANCTGTGPITSNDNRIISRAALLTLSALYKVVFTVTAFTDGDIRIMLGATGVYNDTSPSAQTYTFYRNCVGYGYMYNRANGTMSLDNLTVKPLTDCAATGFHIISAQGGSTQNWTSESGSFNYNDTAYSYKLYKVR